MDKIVIRSECDDHHDIVAQDRSVWYTVVHDELSSAELAGKNPWGDLESIIEAKSYLMDDCVFSFRPARSENRIDNKDYNKDYYFAEISNQDGTVILSSRAIYSWSRVAEIADLFRGLSFQAAARVWGVKKY